MSDKARVRVVLEQQPEDATFDEILRELALARMVETGLQDAREGRVISNDEMAERMRLWQS